MGTAFPNGGMDGMDGGGRAAASATGAAADGGHLLDLYTFQPYDVIERAFRTDGIYQATKLGAYRDGCLDPDEGGELFAPAYQWLSDEMARMGITTWKGPVPGAHGGAAGTGTGTDDDAPMEPGDVSPGAGAAPGIDDGVTPIWAYARWTDSHGRPRSKPDRRCYDFRFVDFLRHHMIHLRIPAWRVMFSDMDAWNCVINRWALPPVEANDWDDARLDQWTDEHYDDPIETKRLQWRAHALIPTGHEPAGNLAAYGNGSGSSATRTIDSTDDLMALPHSCVQATFWWLDPGDVVRVWKPTRPGLTLEEWERRGRR